MLMLASWVLQEVSNARVHLDVTRAPFIRKMFLVFVHCSPVSSRDTVECGILTESRAPTLPVLAESTATVDPLRRQYEA